MSDEGDDDLDEAVAAFRTALAVCLYTGPGCGAHQLCADAEAAAAWCEAHQAERPGHRAEVWPAKVDDLVVINPLARAMYASVREAEHLRRLRAADPDWGKTPVPWRLWEAARDQVEAGTASADLRAIFPHLIPIYPVEEPRDDRSDPRTQPRPAARKRRGAARRRRR